MAPKIRLCDDFLSFFVVNSFYIPPEALLFYDFDLCFAAHTYQKEQMQNVLFLHLLV